MAQELKAQNIVRRAITTAYCMDLDVYCGIFGYKESQMAYAKGKWKMMGRNFGAWFCDLDSHNAKIFMDYVLNRK